ncbi:hypothetical protein DES53_103268 [Roseimicrobium gellanilyticum]|uniref:Glycoside hydrolase/deacetylase ChbG (UPF0249 family) n=1 Tax=Roseimicrobium gellanilyticum TaxID=748857 RepID=A0A366HP28_9BACT|nr:polysaccharide deacetylase family protein [Roseimicrobium gellanilyticum]RBP45270.1 hypothetical protein DES53_103268 [Roseimicrobium gellanilyticum]
MKTFLLLLCVAVSLSVAHAQTAPPRLIVRADDMGYSHAGNEAILKTYKEGIATSVEIIVPSPWFPEAVAMLTQRPEVDVGIHLCLSSEWDNVKWRPLTECPSLRDADGFFFPMIFPNKNYPGRSLAENKWKLEEIEKEFRAQIELALKKIPRISHVTHHMGCSELNSEVSAMAQRLASEYKLALGPGSLGMKRVSYQGPKGTSEEKIASFIKMLEGLEAGKTHLFVDHPGLDVPEVRAIHHIGYENVAVDRQGVTDTFTSPKVREVIKARGIQLISYGDLKR